MKKLSALEIQLLGALESLIEISEHQMVDEEGVMGDHDKRILDYAKKTARRARGLK